MSELSLPQLLDRIRPLDAGAMRVARSRQRGLTKPAGSLGRLEELSVRLAGIFAGAIPLPMQKTVIVAAGDHGVVAEGVTEYPQDVTAQMVLNFLRGGAAINALARHAGASVLVVDAGVAVELPAHPDLHRLRLGAGTGNIAVGPAMSPEQAQRAVLTGAQLAMAQAEQGAHLIGLGDMGIGNTTASSAITAATTGLPAEATTGRGTGLTPQGLAHKVSVVRRALEANRPDPASPMDLLAKVGGYEIGVLVGVILGTAAAGRVVMLDGFISGAAALIACGLCPGARDYLVASHRSVEAGHRVQLRHLRLRPLLDLGMRLGEGTGAVLAMGLVEASARCLEEMATFGEAEVSGRQAGEATAP
jgi:nicotinate-nucleotide--dimethylbenzimidazole phosphoribosyltransferase